MRTLERSTAFKRDFKKHGDIDAALIDVLYKLINDEELPEKYRDHAFFSSKAAAFTSLICPSRILIGSYF